MFIRLLLEIKSKNAPAASLELALELACKRESKNHTFFSDLYQRKQTSAISDTENKK